MKKSSKETFYSKITMTTELFPLPKDIKPFTPKVTVPSTLTFEVPNDLDNLEHLRDSIIIHSRKLQTVPEFLFLLTRDIDEWIKELQDTQGTLKQ